MKSLKIVTYNIHKGFSHFNRRMVLHELRERLRELDADIVFLQEVSGKNTRIPIRHPDLPQHEFLAEDNWLHHAYGKNAVYDNGHHGNALLSRFPILHWDNQDVSAHRFENRGMLHCEISLNSQSAPLHCICVHFGLFSRGRKIQFNALVERIKRSVPFNAPLIIAGDFNDWNNYASHFLAQALQVHEVFHASQGKLARSFPAGLPLLRMDRIYVRGMEVSHSAVNAWRLSDHAALSATLALP
jgi:endonuclease/exonuclease/phosphatase family metal-dependent hydrolase